MDLSKLTYDKRFRLSCNPNTSSEILAILADDKNSYVRRYVTRNPNTPQYIKDYLTARFFFDKVIHWSLHKLAHYE